MRHVEETIKFPSHIIQTCDGDNEKCRKRRNSKPKSKPKLKKAKLLTKHRRKIHTETETESESAETCSFTDTGSDGEDSYKKP